MDEYWKSWRRSPAGWCECHTLRYGCGVFFVLGALLLTLSRPVLAETPYTFFLAAIITTAVCSGLGPAFFATALSTLLVRWFFIRPQFSLYHRGNFEDAERLGWFVLAALMASSLVAACRRERNMLRDSEERYRILAETASEAIIVIDESGEILFVNPFAEETFGASAGKLLGQNLDSLMPRELYQPRITEIQQHLDTRKKAIAVQLPARTLRGGQILLEMTLGTFSKHGRNLFTAIFRDVSKEERVQHIHL
jgi:PAS domain S-box-containing protein